MGARRITSHKDLNYWDQGVLLGVIGPKVDEDVSEDVGEGDSFLWMSREDQSEGGLGGVW